MLKKIFREVRKTLKNSPEGIAALAGLVVPGAAPFINIASAAQQDSPEEAFKNFILSSAISAGTENILGGGDGIMANLFKKEQVQKELAKKNLSGQKFSLLKDKIFGDATGVTGTGDGSFLGSIGDIVKKGVDFAKENPELTSAGIGLLAKAAFEEDMPKPVDINAYRSPTDIKFGSQFGGTPFADERMRGLFRNIETGETFDYPDYTQFQTDEEGRIIPPVEAADGGIMNTNNPFMMRERIKEEISPGVAAMAMGGGTNGLNTYGDRIDMMDNNQGVGQFFPRQMGMIYGPGGPKDDKIPAMLSNGEFVFTAKAVENAGGPKAMYNLMNNLDPESSKGTGIV